MKRLIAMLGLSVLLTLAALVVQADTADVKRVCPCRKRECPACRIVFDDPPDAEAELRMEQAELAESDAEGARAIMTAVIHRDGPGALLGRAARLELTDEQTAKLADIQTRARSEAMAVLTDAQKEKVRALPTGATTPRRTMQDIHSKLKPVLEKLELEGYRLHIKCPIMNRKL